jgi:hypothetical protein
MSEAEIKLRGNRPYDTDEQILARLKKQNKESNVAGMRPTDDTLNKLVDEHSSNLEKLRQTDAEGGTAIGYEEFKALQKRNAQIEEVIKNARKVENETEEQILNKLNKGNKESIERLKNKPLDPDVVLPNYNETPGAYSRRKTPGSKENLLQELKIAYEKEFNRLRGDETAEELKEILKNLDTDGVPFAAGGRAGGVAGLLGERTGYAVGNQVMPAVDPRMNVDYNTLVDQNTAQRATQAQARNPVLQRMQQNQTNQTSFGDRVGFTQHMNEDRMLKDANIENQLMNRMGGLNVTQANPAFGLQNPFGPGIGMTMLGGASGLYQGVQSLLGDQSIGEALKDTYENTMGPKILSNPEQLAQYNKILNRPAAAAEPSAMPQGSSGQLNPTMADVAGPAYRPGFQGEFLTTGPSRDKLFTDVVPDFDKYGNYIGKDQLIKDYAAAGRGTASSQLVKLPENHPYAVSGAGYYTYNGTDFSKTADENMTPEYEKMIRSNYGLASGGRAGFYQGGQAQIEPDLSDIGHGSDALMARNMLIAPGSQATTSTGLNYLLGEDNDTTRVPYKEKGSVTLADLIKVNASGSKSGKNQIMGAPDGITADTETFNAIIKMDIPIMEKINLLGSYGYGKDRFKVEKGNKELFLGEDGYKDRNIGLGFNQDGEGLSGSVIRNLETGDNDYQLKLLKSFAEGGRIGYNEGNMVVPKPKAMDEYLLKQVMSQAGANTLDVRTREMFIEQLKKKIRDKRATEEKKYQFEELRDQGAEDMYYNNREKELDIKYNPQNYPPSMRKFAGGGVAGLLGESPGSTDHGPRTMYAEGQLVQNTVDGSRPGYSGKKAQLVQEVIQLIKNLNKTAKLKGLEEKLIKKYKSEGVGFIEAIKKAQTEAGGVRYEGRMKIIDDAMKEANVHSDDYVDLLDMKIKIEDPDFAKQYVNFPENLKNKTRSRHDPDWAEANFGKEYGTKLDQARSREINQSIDPNFKEPLSQSDQMVSNIDDMNIANTDEFFGRKKNAEGGRIGYEEAGVVDKIGGMVNYKNVPYYVNSAAKGATDMAEWVSRLPFATTKLASDIIRKPLFKPGDRVPGLPGVGAKFVGGEMFNEFINNMTTGSWVDKLGLSSLVEEGGKKVSPEARTVGDIAESLGEFANVGGIFAAGKNLFKGGDSLKKLSQSMGKVKDNKTLEKLVDETLTARGEGRRDFNKLVASGGLMVALQSIGLGGIKAAKTKAAPDAVLTLKTIIDDSDVMTENGLQAIGREGSLIDVSGLTDAVKKSLAVIMKNRKNTFGNKVVRNKVKGKDGKFTEDYEDIPTEEAAYIMEELQKRGHNVKLEHYDDMGGLRC